MLRKNTLLLTTLAAVLLAAAAPIWAQDETTAASIRKIMDKARPVLAHVTFNLEEESRKTKIECAGIVVSADGLVLLSSDLFNEEYSEDDFMDFEVQIELPEGPKTWDAKYLGKNTAARVAMLKIKKEKTNEKFAFAAFNDNASIDVGDHVLVVGYMGKQFNYKRDYRLGRITAVVEKPVRQYGLTPAAMHIENALIFNIKGEPLGVLKQSVGISLDEKEDDNSKAAQIRKLFGVKKKEKIRDLLLYPSAHFSKLIAAPPTRNEKPRPWLGVMGLQNLNKALAEYWGLGEKTKGVIVGHVITNGPGEKIGLKANDVILAVNGKKLDTDAGNSVNALNEKVKQMETESQIRLTVFRNGKKLELAGKLGYEPKKVGRAKKIKFKDDFKFTIRELVFFDLYNRDLPRNKNGCIVHYTENGWASDGGLRPDDIITKIGDTEVKNIGQFKELFDKAAGKKPKDIIISVLRGKTNESKIIRIECHWKK